MPIVQTTRLLTDGELEEVQKKISFPIRQVDTYHLIEGPVIVFKFQSGIAFAETTKAVEDALGELCKKL